MDITKLVYTVDNSDFIAFNQYYRAHSPLFRKQFIRYRFIGPIIYVAIGFSGYLITSDPIFLIIFVVLAIGWLISTPFLLDLYYKRLYKSHVKET